MERKIDLAYSIDDQRSIKLINSHAIKVFNKELSIVSGMIQNHTISTALANGPSIDKHLEVFGKTYFKSIKTNFLKNPRHWARLGAKARRLRSWVLEPNLMYVYLHSKLQNHSGFKSYLPQLEEFISKLPKIPTHPMMTIGGPALLLTGKGYNSLSYNYTKFRNKTADGLSLGRSFDFQVGSKYLSNHFLGSIVTKNVRLKLTTQLHNSKQSENFMFRFSIPFVFVQHFKNLTLEPVTRRIYKNSSGYTDTISVEIYNEIMTVPKRNPFYLNKESKEKLELLKDNLIFTTQNDLVNKGLL